MLDYVASGTDGDDDDRAAAPSPPSSSSSSSEQKEKEGPDPDAPRPGPGRVLLPHLRAMRDGLRPRGQRGREGARALPRRRAPRPEAARRFFLLLLLRRFRRLSLVACRGDFVPDVIERRGPQARRGRERPFPAREGPPRSPGPRARRRGRLEGARRRRGRSRGRAGVAPRGLLRRPRRRSPFRRERRGCAGGTRGRRGRRALRFPASPGGGGAPRSEPPASHRGRCGGERQARLPLRVLRDEEGRGRRRRRVSGLRDAAKEGLGGRGRRRPRRGRRRDRSADGGGSDESAGVDGGGNDGGSGRGCPGRAWRLGRALPPPQGFGNGPARRRPRPRGDVHCCRAEGAGRLLAAERGRRRRGAREELRRSGRVLVLPLK